MYKILIIEDDTVIASALAEHLRKWGFEAELAADFSDIMRLFAETGPQLVLLDIALPFFSGYYWCSKIREISKIPVIFISSAADNMNIVMAMDMGGDDFIAKPFDLNVLTAKIRALIRRTYEFRDQTKIIERGGVILNLNEAALYFNGNKIPLTKNEFRIMSLLLENAGRVVSREEIMTSLWESDSYIDDNTLTVNMTRLRRKLEDAGLPDFITTKKGLGYMVD
jgi:DNA-binding response OmpR family regulator